MHTFKYLLASAVILSCAAPALAAGPFSAVYSFGDSLSDVGNVYTYTGVPGNGPQLPASPYSNGQFSNGPVWNQILATGLGLGPLTPSILGGNGYAWGNATTGYPDTANTFVPTFLQQVGLFSLDHGFVAPSSALYTLSIGANDLKNILESSIIFDPVATKAAADGAAAALAAGVATLAAEGMKNLAWFDVPDLGLTPEIKSFNSPALSAAATALSAYFNQQVLLDLQPLIASGLKVYDLDAFSLIQDAVANPVAYGFTNVESACYVGDYYGGGSACATPDSYLFWDHIHPSARGHELIAADAYAKVTATPEPATWALALIGFAGLAFWRRREIRAAA